MKLTIDTNLIRHIRIEEHLMLTATLQALREAGWTPTHTQCGDDCRHRTRSAKAAIKVCDAYVDECLIELRNGTESGWIEYLPGNIWDCIIDCSANVGTPVSAAHHAITGA